MGPSIRALLVLALALVVLAGAVIAAHRATRPRRGVILQAAALDERQLLLLWSTENRPEPELELVDLERGPRWSRRAPGVTPLTSNRPWIAVAAGTVALRSWAMPEFASGAERTPVELGLSLADGDLRWRRAPLPHRASGLAFTGLYTTILTDDEVIYQLYEELERWFLVVARDARSGRELWRYQQRHEVTAVGPAWLAAGRLVLADLDGLRVVDGDTGRELRHIDLLGSRPCVVGDEVYFSREGALIELRLDDLSERPLGREQTIDGPRQLLLQGRCGRRGETLLLATSSAIHAYDERLELRWELHLDGSSFVHVIAGDRLARRFPRSIPFSGELPRFVPVLMRPERADGRELVMLDLDRGEVAWASAPREELLHSHLFRHRDHFVLVERGGQRAIALFDGATGRLTAARRVQGLMNAPDGLLPSHVVGDRFVLFGGARRVTVDAETLELAGGEEVGQEIAGELSERLGIPPVTADGGGGQPDQPRSR